jgi:creatinine deaminase
MYKVKRVVIGENKNFLGGEEYLKSKGIEVVVLHNKELQTLMKTFIKKHPEEWYVWMHCGVESMLTILQVRRYW